MKTTIKIDPKKIETIGFVDQTNICVLCNPKTEVDWFTTLMYLKTTEIIEGLNCKSTSKTT